MQFEINEYGSDGEGDEEDWGSDDGTASIAPSMMSHMSTMSKMSLMSSASDAPGLELDDPRFLAIIDEFDQNWEVVGNKLKASLGTNDASGPEKYGILRASIAGDDREGIGAEENKRRILKSHLNELQSSLLPGRNKGQRLEKMERVKREEDEGEKWDVESVLCTLPFPQPTGHATDNVHFSHLDQYRQPPRQDSSKISGR